LAEIGSSLDPSYIQRSEDWSLDQGYKAAKLLLAQQSNLTAIFCQNDWLALGAYRAIREHNLRIPDDISVIGYDNVPVCLYVSPPLSSVQQPKATLGKLLAQLLINAVEQGVTDSQTMLLRAELIVRDSVSSVSKSN
jgi:DNA-binding LacI/PurR family transcriptional regulator